MKRRAKPCTCGHLPPRHRLGCLNAPTGATFERWRMLMPDQRFAVVRALAREEKRLAALAARERAKGTRPEPFGGHRREAAFRHASRAGACRIARLILEAVGGYP